MSNIRITKIDGQEFVLLKDYLRLKEIAHNGLEELKKAAETIKELEEENKKLKERIAELEKCNLNLQEHIDKLLNRK